MGNSKGNLGTIPKLKNSEIQAFAKQTLFSNDKIESLFTHFYLISSLQIDDGVIDFSEFCSRLSLETSSLLSRRVFHLFDANGDGVINFREFLLGISTFIYDTGGIYDASSSNLNSLTIIFEQIDVAFRLFDMRNVGRIYKKDLGQFLRHAINQTSGLNFSEKQLDTIVDHSFQDVEYQVDEDGEYLDKEAFVTMIRSNPVCLKWLSVDFDRVIEGTKLVLRSRKRRKNRCFSIGSKRSEDQITKRT